MFAHNTQTGIALQWELGNTPPVQRSVQRTRNGFLTSSSSSHLPTAVPTNSNSSNSNSNSSSSNSSRSVGSSSSSTQQQFDQSLYAPLQLPHSYRVAEAQQLPPPPFSPVNNGLLNSIGTLNSTAAAPTAATAAAAGAAVQRLTTEGIVHFAACCRDIGRRGTAASRRCSGALLLQALLLWALLYLSFHCSVYIGRWSAYCLKLQQTVIRSDCGQCRQYCSACMCLLLSLCMLWHSSNKVLCASQSLHSNVEHL
jgi:hypothetical protein